MTKRKIRVGVSGDKNVRPAQTQSACVRARMHANNQVINGERDSYMEYLATSLFYTTAIALLSETLQR